MNGCQAQRKCSASPDGARDHCPSPADWRDGSRAQARIGQERGTARADDAGGHWLDTAVAGAAEQMDPDRSHPVGGPCGTHEQRSRAARTPGARGAARRQRRKHSADRAGHPTLRRRRRTGEPADAAHGAQHRSDRSGAALGDEPCGDALSRSRDPQRNAGQGARRRIAGGICRYATAGLRGQCGRHHRKLDEHCGSGLRNGRTSGGVLSAARQLSRGTARETQWV